MRRRSRSFLKEKFNEYYSNRAMEPPPRLKEREWGVIPVDENYPEKTIMKRHKSFSNPGELNSYLGSISPAHVYFSSAYYERPSARTMEEKGWRGADLVFDLDADHLVGSESLSYSEMLDKVKEETIHLLDEFLLDDFGLDRSEVKVVFSGGRGYHIHVREEKVRSLGSRERREIIDYLFGVGTRDPIYEREEKGARIPRLREGGSRWESDIISWIVEDYLERIAGMRREQAIKELSRFDGVGEKIAGRLFDYLKEDENLEKVRRRGKLDIAKGVPVGFWKQLAQRAKREVRAEADEPVTSDIKRLIRLPNSLHGGTGFIVRPVKINDIEHFEPLRDAITFGRREVKIIGKRNFSGRLKGIDVRVEEGKIKTVPEFAAVFLVGSGFAEVEGW